MGLFGLKQEKLKADIDNVRSQIKSRGLQDGLTEQNIALVGANVAIAKQNLMLEDPNREMTERERQEFLDKQFGSIVGRLFAADPETSDQTVMKARNAFYAAMTPEGVSHSEDEE